MTKQTTTILTATSILVAGATILYFVLTGNGEPVNWYDSSWLYRKAIYLETPDGLGSITEDILIEENTASLISQGKLAPDCSDLRFLDGDNITTLKYWIEGGCGTNKTQIWTTITTEAKSSEKTIYMYYGNDKAIDNQEVWEGDFITMTEEPNPEGCDMTENFSGRFVRGSDTYGEVGGKDFHLHSFFNTEGVLSCTNPVTVAILDEESTCNTTEDNILSPYSTSGSTVPEYEELFFYRNEDGYLKANSIILFDQESPYGWQTYKPLVGKFPVGKNLEKESEYPLHTHTQRCTNVDLLDPLGEEQYFTLKEISMITAERVDPPFLQMNYIISTEEGVIPVEGIVMTTEVPPLGWERYVELDDNFPKGTDGNFGETGGSEYHSHRSSLNIEIRMSTRERLNNIETTQTCLDITSLRNVTEESSLPTYLTMIFAKKKTSLSTVSKNRSGEEENVEGILGISTTQPSKPTSLQTEGQTNPNDLGTLAPGFTAIFNHPHYP